MEGVYDVFINHRGPDVKRTLASLIYHRLESHGLRVFLDKHELQAGDSLSPAIKYAISSASVQIAIFSKTYAQSAWCLNELLWMLDSSCSIIIPIFYDIQPSDLRHVGKGAYAEAFQEHRDKERVSTQQIDSWISALVKISSVSGTVISTDKDDLGERLEEIVEVILKEVRREELDVGKYPVGLRQAAEDFEREVLNGSEISGVKVVGIVGLDGSGKSTLVTHLYNSKRSQFHRSCFLSEAGKRDIVSVQQTLLRDLLCDYKSQFHDTLRGRAMLRKRLQGLRCVLIVFDDINNTLQIENLLFLKDVVGDGSLILVTSKDQSLFVSCYIELYNIKLLDSETARELFCWHAFGQSEAEDNLQAMVKELVGMCSGFPLALKVLAGKLQNERDPKKWKKELEILRQQLPSNLLEQIVKNSYESLEIREREAFLDIAHFFIGEDEDLVEKILDGLNGSGSQCLQMLRQKCLVEFECADEFLLRAELPSWSISSTLVWKRARGSLKIRMHNLVRDLAIQIGIKEAPLRVCRKSDKMITQRESHLLGDEFDVRGIGVDDPFSAVTFRKRQRIRGLKLLAFQNPKFFGLFTSISGDLIWFRFSADALMPSFLRFSGHGVMPLIPPTLSLRNLRVLEVHGVSPQDFCNLFGDCEPPWQPRELTVTCKRHYEMYAPWTAGPSTPAFPKLGKEGLVPKPSHLWLPGISSTPDLPKLKVASKTTNLRQSLIPSENSYSLQPPINTAWWFQTWLGKMNFHNLAKIVLQNILHIETFPINFEEARNLRHVDFSGCEDLNVLPHSFTERLLQLQYLALTGCRKLVLPSLGKISTLEYLDCDGCSMLNELPTGTEAQKSLNYLSALNMTDLRQLPHSLQQLKNLEELLIGSPWLTELPSSLYTLSSLTDLTLIGCTNLHFIDNSIEKLVNLERLRIYKCGVETLPERLAWKNMKILDVQNCQMYSHHLKIGYMPAGSSHNQSSCLTDLIIRGSYISGIHIRGAENHFPKLEIIDLSSSIYLSEIGRLPTSLINLMLNNCRELTTLVDLSNLAGLKVLDISGCVQLRTLNLEGLTSIEVIKAEGCPADIQRIQGPTQLEKLSYVQISVASLIDIMTSAPNISTAILSGSTTNVNIVEMDTAFRRFEGVKVRRIFQSDQWERNVKPRGAILLYLLTDQNSNIKVTFFGHVYNLHSSSSKHPVHLLLWTEDSEVYKDYKHSIEPVNCLGLLKGRVQKGWMIEAEDYKRSIEPVNYLGLLKGRVQQGWMVEAEDSVTCKSIISYFCMRRLFNSV